MRELRRNIRSNYSNESGWMLSEFAFNRHFGLNPPLLAAGTFISGATRT